jgi:3-oxoacyl-[acyl-carrier-protein] synthase-3
VKGVAFGLAGTASYLPERVVDNSFFGGDDGGARTSAMFRGSRTRHHVAPGETATDMIMHATRRLADRLGFDARRDLDLILTNVSCPDMPFTGCGAVVTQRLGARPRYVMDFHNSGCISFVYMMQAAQALMTTMGAKTALLCNVQNAGGRVFAHPANRPLPQSAVPGDGCGVGLLVAGGGSPIRSLVVRAFGDYAEDMRVVSDDGQPWWEPRQTPLHIDFTEDRIAQIVGRGNKLVPEVIREACVQAEVAPAKVDVLVTNQPNATFLRNWRESLQLTEAQHVHTFAEHGNLFGAALPISIERAVETGRLTKGSTLALGGFSHAGDYAAAAIVDWQA